MTACNHLPQPTAAVSSTNYLHVRTPAWGRSVMVVFTATLSDRAYRKNHLWSSPVAFPFYRTYDVLRQSSAACKALKVPKTTVLKRLASAVRLRPWPPNL